MDPLEGHKGLGYSGELKGSGLLNEKYGQRADIMKGKKGRGITGQVIYREYGGGYPSNPSL